MDDLDLAWNEYPVCPYCGKKEEDAWEIHFGDGMEGSTEITCSNCEKDYFATRHVDVKYSTKPLEAK
jgi:hypothetical protein